MWGYDLNPLRQTIASNDVITLFSSLEKEVDTRPNYTQLKVL